MITASVCRPTSRLWAGEYACNTPSQKSAYFPVAHHRFGDDSEQRCPLFDLQLNLPHYVQAISSRPVPIISNDKYIRLNKPSNMRHGIWAYDCMSKSCKLSPDWFTRGNEPKRVRSHAGKGLEGTLHVLGGLFRHAHR